MLHNLKGILRVLSVITTRGCCHASYKRLRLSVQGRSTIHYLFNSLTAERSSIQHIYRIRNQCNMKQCFPLAAVYSRRRSYVPIMPVLRGRHQSQACNCADISHRKRSSQSYCCILLLCTLVVTVTGTLNGPRYCYQGYLSRL